MASLQFELPASSTPFAYVSLKEHNRSTNIKGYNHSQSQGIRKNKAESEDNDSWLPMNDQTSISEAKGSKHRKGQHDVDDSWLPNTNKTKSRNDTYIKNKNKNYNNNNKRDSLWALARKVVFSRDQRLQNANSSRIQQQSSPSKSRSVVESPTSRVSSLLQRWADFAETKNLKGTRNSSPSSNRNNTLSPFKGNKNNNSSNSPWTQSTDANGAEKDKTGVVDIIKKLSREAASHHAGGSTGNESLVPPIRTTLKVKPIEGSENKDLKGVKISRHQIRGKHAFNNFLTQMEHDKHHELKWLAERNAVSKFSHPGRIQALLRFKRLRLGVKGEPKPCVSKTLESNNRLDIVDIRERFNSGVEKGSTESMKHKSNDIKNTANKETSATTSTGTREVDVKTKTTATTTINKQEPQQKPESMAPNQSTQVHSTSSSNDVSVHKAKFLDCPSSFIKRTEDGHYKDWNKYNFYNEDEGQFMSARTSYDSTHLIEDRGIGDLEETNYIDHKQAFENFEQWMANEYNSQQTRSDHLDEEDQSYDIDTSYDWISDVSRPKSHWEDLRKTRYQHMLHRSYSSGNGGDIQRLLERKNVSSFLSSRLRDLIDQVMASRVQQSSDQVEKQIVVREKGESTKEEVKQEDNSTVDDVDYRIRTEPQSKYNENIIDRTPNSETTTTSPSSSDNNNTPQSSPAVTRHTIEMDLIYDLRGHMEQLHQEIMDLRKSIKSCVTMQVKMQHSFKQHVANTDQTHSVQNNEKKPPGLVKHDCSVCCDMQVDSLLYRCGHMCTCFKCALELQRASGECPVCDAPIVDVVKAFVHES